MSARCSRRERPKAPAVLEARPRRKKRLDEQFLRAQRLESIGMLAFGIAHDLNNVLGADHPGGAGPARACDQSRTTSDHHSRSRRAPSAASTSSGQILRLPRASAAATKRWRSSTCSRRRWASSRRPFRRTSGPGTTSCRTTSGRSWPTRPRSTRCSSTSASTRGMRCPTGGVLRSGRELPARRARRRRDRRRVGGRLGGPSRRGHGTGIPPEVLEPHLGAVLHHQGARARAPGSGFRPCAASSTTTRASSRLKTRPEGNDLPGLSCRRPRWRRRSTNLDPIRPSTSGGQRRTHPDRRRRAAIRDITAAILSRYGYRVLIAGDGSEAVALFAVAQQRDQHGRDRHAACRTWTAPSWPTSSSTSTPR